MRVFLSWSGERSRQIASALHDWLPLVLQSLRPWFSGYDINAGSRWSSEIAKELEESRFAIICLTPENLEASWLHFEAGALARSLQGTFVVPYLFGFEPRDLQGPLAQFQAARANKDDTWLLMQTMNRALGDSGIREDRLRTLIDTLWPTLEAQFKAIEGDAPPVLAGSAQQTMSDEIRGFDTLTSRISNLEETIRALVATPSQSTSVPPIRSSGQNVFLVHGHDEGVKEAVARFLEKLGTVAVILQEQPNEGRTIIEKFEDFSNVGYAIVLMTADDIGSPIGAAIAASMGGPIGALIGAYGPISAAISNQASSHAYEAYRSRARQNVIFELGYFVAKIGRSRVCVLYEEGVEMPSDFSGVLYVKLDKEGGWRFSLARELKTSGINVDLNRIFE